MSRKSNNKIASGTSKLGSAPSTTVDSDVGNDTVREEVRVASAGPTMERTSERLDAEPDQAGVHGHHEHNDPVSSSTQPSETEGHHTHDRGHDHRHVHGHHHGSHGAGAHHHHHHAAPTGPVTKAFAVGVALNALFVVVGIGAGLYAESTALLADAAHNLGDVVGLLLGWGAAVLAQSAPTERRTYGFRRATIIAALANSLLIVFAVGAVGWESLRRLGSPSPVNGGIVALVAAFGVVVNVVSARMFMAGQKHDLNQRGAYLHLLGDAAVSAGVVVAGIIVHLTGWMWADPLTSIVVSALILWSAWRLLKESALLMLDAVPPHVDPTKVRAFLLSHSGVNEVHDLHIWSVSTSEVALTAHLVIDWQSSPPHFMSHIDDELQSRFGIHHATLQLEALDADKACHRTMPGAV